MVGSGNFNFASNHGRYLATDRPTDRPTDRLVGLPIGNLTSQFFANVYLNGLDHFIKEQLRCRYYLRYMDDFVVFHHDKRQLWAMQSAIIEYLQLLHLQLHEGKSRIFQTGRGVPFLGMTLTPTRRRLQRASIVHFMRNVRRLQRAYCDRHVDPSDVRQSIAGWCGYAGHADTMQLRTRLLEDVVFRRKGG